MADDNGGNGKQRQINGLVHEDNMINSKLDDLKDSVDTLAADFKEFIAPDGVCVEHRLKTASFIRQVTVQWWLIGVMVTGLVGLAFAVLKGGGAG